MEDCLPQNFAQKILQLESILDEQYSMQTIQQLNQLYRIGIDYYVRQQPRKAMHFQKKMTNLLANPKTLNIIQEPQRYRQQQNKNPQQFRKNVKLQSKIKDQVMKFQSFSDEYIKNIMQNSQKVIRKNQQLRIKDLNKQEQKLEERIMLKKVKSQQKLNMFSPRKN